MSACIDPENIGITFDTIKSATNVISIEKLIERKKYF
jgi:hypothetical protein